jgi:hypothetical protein
VLTEIKDLRDVKIFEINNHIGYRVLKGIGYVVARRLSGMEGKMAVGNQAKS